MKKQLLLLAIVGGALAVAAPQVQAQAPLPTTQFNPDAVVNATGNTANTITVSGTIPEFINFTAVDNAIEMGNIGGPVLVGRAISVDGRRGNDPAGGTTAFTKNTDSGAGLGDAKVEFQSNTFIRVKFAGTNLTNSGPDGTVGTADDVVLPTYFRVAIKGKVQFANGNTRDGGVFNGPGGTGQNPTNPGDYASYTGAAATASNNPNDVNLTYSPGGPVNDGFGSANTDPNLPSGFRVMAEADRNGLNDYRGAYNSKINLTYFKY